MSVNNVKSASDGQFRIRRREIEDALEIKLLADRVFTGDTLMTLVYPPERAHLSSPEELHEWQVSRRRKMAEKGDGDNFVMLDTSGPTDKIIGFCRWDAPGRFAKGQSLVATMQELNQNTAAIAEPQSNGEPATVKDSKDEEIAPPACVDVEVHKQMGEKMDEIRNKIWGDNTNFWYLAALAVDPDYQRRGLATRMMQFGLDRADADGLPIYLESSAKGEPVYPRFGFEKCGEFEVRGAANRVVTEVVMIRQPKKRD